MPSPLVSRVSQIALTVDDLDEAVAFYRDTLGLAHLFTSGGMAFFDCGGTRLLVGTENAQERRTLLYFATDDIETATKTLEARGAAIDARPRVVARLPGREVWLARFRDPAGTLHHLLSEVPVAG